MILSCAVVSCNHVGLKYKAEFESNEKGSGVVLSEKSYPVRWLAVMCGGTFWAYGGACWFYYMYPTDSMTTEIRKSAIDKLASEVPDFKIKKETLEPNQWTFLFEQSQILTGVEYQKFISEESKLASKKTIDTQSPQQNVEIDLKDFEQSIVSKPSKNEVFYSDKDGFPNGWPEKWYFETSKFRYWTIVGELKDNQSSAMTSSAIKAQEVLSKEFPRNTYKTLPKFESTHNQIKKIKGQYQSWRIIRVLHEEVAKLTL